MEIESLKSKVHRAVITEANLNYVGSITLDEDLMDAANIIENEKVQVVNVNNGERLETYVIKGKRGSGICCLNGPAARKGMTGDTVIVISYASMSFEEAKQFSPRIVFPKEGNKLLCGLLPVLREPANGTGRSRSTMFARLIIKLATAHTSDISL